MEICIFSYDIGGKLEKIIKISSREKGDKSMVNTIFFVTLIVYGQKVLILSKECLFLTILDDMNPESKYLKTG